MQVAINNLKAKRESVVCVLFAVTALERIHETNHPYRK